VTTLTDYETPKGVPIELHRNRFLSVKFDGYHHYVDYNKYKSGVVVVARFPNGDYQMVRLQRSPVFGVSLELVRGGVETDELPSEAVLRELLEETGYLANATSLVHLGQVGGDTATINSLCDVFEATIDDSVPAAPFDEQEIQQPVRLSTQDLHNALVGGGIKDGYTLAALMLSMARSSNYVLTDCDQSR